MGFVWGGDAVNALTRIMLPREQIEAIVGSAELPAPNPE